VGEEKKSHASFILIPQWQNYEIILFIALYLSVREKYSFDKMGTFLPHPEYAPMCFCLSYYKL